MTRVALDRALAWRALILTILLCWPLMLFGRPGYYSDSRSYYNGGAVAVSTVLAKLSHHQAARPSAAAANRRTAPPPSQGIKTAQSARGLRSISYSVLAFLFGAPDGTMVLLCVVQAALSGSAIAAFLRAVEVNGAGFWIVAGTLAFLTPAAWFNAYAMPDIFAGLLVLAMTMLVFLRARLSTGVSTALVLLGAFAISAHSSHIPIALLLLPLGLAWVVLRSWRDARRIDLRGCALVAAPVVLGLVGVVASGFIGFGEVSVAPRRYPLVLARSIGDGPGRWYLERHCGTAHYAVCELFGRDIPRTSMDFLWGPRGISTRATPEQMARLRAEEQEIALSATLAYPGSQISKSAYDFARQLVYFRIGDAYMSLRLTRDPFGTLVPAPRVARPQWLARLVNILCFASAIAAAVWLLFALPFARPERRALALFVVAGLLANAAVCTVFSGVADRYQARVIWLLPLAAAALPVASRRWPGRAAHACNIAVSEG